MLGLVHQPYGGDVSAQGIHQAEASGERALPPVLFVHGSFSRGALLEPWVRHFASAGFECHAPSLPGRDPTDPDALRRLGMRDYLQALLEVRAALPAPPVVIGHSMGGLLAQQLAAASPCAALVCVASAPPGVLWAQPRALPHLARLLPAILPGRPTLPSERTLRAVVFNDLAENEASRLAAELVPDSGRAFRSMMLGLVRVPRAAVRCPVLCLSGGSDRNVSNGISRAIAKRYDADHQVFPERGHWLIAESGVEEVAGAALAWLQKVLDLESDRVAPAKSAA